MYLVIFGISVFIITLIMFLLYMRTTRQVNAVEKELVVFKPHKQKIGHEPYAPRVFEIMYIQQDTQTDKWVLNSKHVGTKKFLDALNSREISHVMVNGIFYSVKPLGYDMNNAIIEMIKQCDNASFFTTCSMTTIGSSMLLHVLAYRFDS